LLTPNDIVDHLGTYLHRATDLFADTIAVSSAEVGVDNVVTIVTASAHGLSVGSTFSVSAASVTIPITGFSSGRFETTLDHDLTEPKLVNDLTTITLSGFTDSAWNGDFEIDQIPNRYLFSVTNENSDPTLNGNEKLTVNRSISVFGINTVDSIVSPTSFTFTAINAPDMETAEIDGMELVTKARVTAAANFDRADEMYTKYSDEKLWLFVIMTDADVSKDRHSINDSVATFSQQDEMRLRLLQNFSFVVFFPSSSELSGYAVQQLAYGEVFEALLNVMYGFGGFAKAEDGSNFVAVTTGHGVGQYTPAYYTQVYDWQLPVDITANGWNFFSSVAFRNIEGTLPMNTSDNLEKLTLSINLDEEQ